MTAHPLTGIPDDRLRSCTDAGTDLASSALFARIDRVPGCRGLATRGHEVILTNFIKIDDN
jgi:hypothetical protein